MLHHYTDVDPGSSPEGAADHLRWGNTPQKWPQRTHKIGEVNCYKLLVK